MKFTLDKLQLVLSLTSIRSPAMLQAFELYYLSNMPLPHIVKFVGVSNSNFCKANKKFIDVATVVERILNLEHTT
jgi:transposase-like protein